MSKYTKRPKKKSKKWLIPVLIVAIVALVIGAGAAVLRQYYNMSHYVSDDQVKAAAADLTEDEKQIIEENIEDTGLTEADEADLRAMAEAAQKDVTLPENKDVYNILLIGVDRRDESWNGNSDSMILLSINKKTKTMHMISFMRDLYADIPGHGIRKLNAAHAYGGAPLLIETIQNNYGVHIDNYASVNFNNLIDIIDMVGGVELEMSDEEAKLANQYATQMCKLRGVDPAEHMLPGGGTYNCDGYQAVAYARIRYVGNADYQRTERQRTVLTKIMEKAKGMGLSELNNFAQMILPLVTHNIDSSTVMSLMVQLPAILNYDVEKDRVPYDGMFSSRGEILVPDMGATIAKLQETLYS